MDSPPANANEVPFSLSECVSDEMSASQAAESTRECWTDAEAALAPVIGREGLCVVFRHGEQVAERKLEFAPPSSARTSIDAFCDWARSLSTRQAVAVCKAFLKSTEEYLLSMLSAPALRRLLRRGRKAGHASGHE
jgi:hypothetical protein